MTFIRAQSIKKNQILPYIATDSGIPELRSTEQASNQGGIAYLVHGKATSFISFELSGGCSHENK